MDYLVSLGVGGQGLRKRFYDRQRDEGRLDEVERIVI
jgi:hypothetical protein